MAEIKNYTLNFGSGQALRALDFAGTKSACTEIECNPSPAHGVAHG
jgi:hypothetical protein